MRSIFGSITLKRAAVLPRVSTLGQAKDGYSLDWQISELPIMARAGGAICEEEDIYIEIASGANDDRPEYNKMLAKVMEGYYQEIWVVEKSRLSRTENRAEEQRIVEALQKFGCVIRTPGTTFDVSTLEGEFFNDIDSAVNRMERKRIKQRMYNGKSEKVRKGGYNGGKHPTGYRSLGRDTVTGKVLFEIDPVASEMVKLAFRLCEQGQTPYRIEECLYEKGYRNQKGNKIEQSLISQWLRNPHYAGYNRSIPKGIIVDKNEYLEPLVSKKTFASVQAFLDRTLVVRDKRATHPLSGILRCGNCSLPMISGLNGKHRIYVCPSKNRQTKCRGEGPKSIVYNTAHQLVLDALPLVIEALKMGDSVNKAAKQKAQDRESNNKHIELEKRDLLKKINTLMDQQENRYSEIREARIAKLETHIKQLESKVILKVAPPKLIIPKPFEELLAYLSPIDTTQLEEIFPLVFNKIHFERRCYGNYEITRVELATGYILKLNRYGKLVPGSK